MYTLSHVMDKQKQKASGFEISVFYWSFSSDIIAVNGLTSTKKQPSHSVFCPEGIKMKPKIWNWRVLFWTTCFVQRWNRSNKIKNRSYAAVSIRPWNCGTSWCFLQRAQQVHADCLPTNKDKYAAVSIRPCSCGTSWCSQSHKSSHDWWKLDSKLKVYQQKDILKQNPEVFILISSIWWRKANLFGQNVFGKGSSFNITIFPHYFPSVCTIFIFFLIFVHGWTTCSRLLPFSSYSSPSSAQPVHWCNSSVFCLLFEIKQESFVGYMQL